MPGFLRFARGISFYLRRDENAVHMGAAGGDIHLPLRVLRP